MGIIYDNYDVKPRFDRLVIKDCEFIYDSYFDGHKGPFNMEGKRNFNVIIPGEEVERLEAEPWNLSWTKPNDNYPDERAYLPVEARFNDFGPNIYVVKNGKTIGKLSEEDLDNGAIEYMDADGRVKRRPIEKVDIVIRPSVYWSTRTLPNQYRVKAYLDTMYIEFRETKSFRDPFRDEYHTDVYELRNEYPEEVPFN